MPTWLIIVIVVLVVLAVGGIIARSMQLKRSAPAFTSTLERVNRDLAQAAAEDRGWDRETLEAAARRLFAQQRGREPDEMMLIEVLDRPGTDEDQAVFRTVIDGNGEHLTLGRRAGDWVLGSLSPQR